PQLVVADALAPDLSPDAAGARAHGGARENRRREDQAHQAPCDRAPLGPLLAAWISGLLEVDLPVGAVHDRGRVDQLDRSFAIHCLEVLDCRVGLVFVPERRDKYLNCAGRHVPFLFLGDRLSTSAAMVAALGTYTSGWRARHGRCHFSLFSLGPRVRACPSSSQAGSA